MACVPVLIYELTYGFSTDYETVTKMINSGWYWLWSLFKIFRLLQVDRIREVLWRASYLFDDLFPMKKVLILNIRLAVWVAVRFIVATHIFACIWIAVSAPRIPYESI